MHCPACGGALGVMEAPGGQGGGFPLPGASAVGQQRFSQDAVIAMAILVILLLLWRLTTRPEGSFGERVKTTVFGPLGLQLAQAAGLAPPQSSSDGAPWPAATPTPMPSANSPPGTNTLARVEGGSQESRSREEPSVTNTPVKYIKALPSDLREPTPREAAGLAKRLDEASAQSGDVQFSLFWNNYNDLDLHCIDPKSVEIWFNNRMSRATGGRLDVDQNANPPFHEAAVENIFWPVGGAPSGKYVVFVTYYAHRVGADPIPYTVRTVVHGKTNWFSHTISHTGLGERHWICTIQYDPANPDPAGRCRFLSQFP